jgi:Na+/glutamate symporter
MVLELFLNLGCIDVYNCSKGGDLSNTAAKYIGIVAGFVLGGLISWWIYNRQEKTADNQDKTVKHLEELGIKEEHILEKVQAFEEKHDNILNNI